ncbi:amino acid adenylation domain-containing protein [Nocardia sp. NPDC059177]|uniref:amino acid adenylation domain-containing protein n=1 Tax=Nocardia sp. NPDC059177 TaxID=3346759 RepID=UPI0036CDBB22
MFGKAEVRELVAADLGVAPESIGFDDDLVGLGMHSMKLMHLSAKWRKQGYDLRSSSLALRPTINAWVELLTAAGGSAEPAPVTVAPDVAGEEFELATMQHAYWVGRRQGQALGGVAAHLYVEFDGAGLEPERLRRAVDALLRRHDMLRAQFLDSGTQRILPQPLVPVFASADLSGHADADAELERIRQDKSHQRMDVGAGQVVDIAVSTLADGRHRLHLDVDMVAADAQSYRRILDDLAALYAADGGDTLPALGITFRQYLATKSASAPDNSADAAWWADRITTLPDIPSLPVVPENERADAARSIRLHHWFDAGTKAALHRNAHGNGVTPAVALATVFGEALARWSAQQRFLLNLPLFAREQLHDDIDQVVGDFTNSVLVEVDASARESTVARAKRLQRELHTCAEHSGYEGLDVLRDLGKLRGGPVTPSVVFTSGLDLGELFSERVTEVFGEPVWIISQGPQVDIDAQVAELNGGLLVNWDIRRDALPAGVAEAMFAEFRRIVDSLVAPGADWTADLTIDLPAAQRAVRAEANNTAADLGARTLHADFFDRAAQDPERIALRWRDGGSATYGELAAQALSVAGALAEAGVRPGDTVAVIVGKGHRQIPAVLGVLAAGATYLPIATDQPPARRDRILARGNVRVALVDNLPGLAQPTGAAGNPAAESAAAAAGEQGVASVGAAAGSVPARVDFGSVPPGSGSAPARSGSAPVGAEPARWNSETVETQMDTSDIPADVRVVALGDALAGPGLDAPVVGNPDDLAYVLFTSGSTGEPKGVEVSHRAAANTIDAIDTRFGVGEQDRFIGLSALGFDLSVYDIFAPLARGGALVCVDSETERDAQAWAELIAETGVTVVNAAPGLITMLLELGTAEQLRTVRLVLTGGDRVRTELAQRLRALVPGLRFVGLGGTTETAIHSTVCEVTDDFPAEWDNVPYGTPLANVALRVVNQRGEDCPDWVLGELWIGGASVADGYRGDPERTADRFVEHDGTRWYRTGDLARYLPDGTVDFLGRADHQVKIRGYRVELGEIESALTALPEIAEAVALITDSGRLAAAVTTTTAAEATAATTAAEATAATVTTAAAETTAATAAEATATAASTAAEAAAGVATAPGRTAGSAPVAGSLTAATVLDRLHAALPPYMIPDAIEVLDRIPLTANGKLDRAAIRKRLAADGDLVSAYVAPANELESALAYIAAQVLDIERIGVETDFFDVGGNSILATTLTAKVRGLLAVDSFGVAAVLDGRTVRRISDELLAAEAVPARLLQVARILCELAEIDLPEPVITR